MIHKDFRRYSTFAYMVSSLQDGLRDFCGTWLRCNSLEWPFRVVAPCPATPKTANSTLSNCWVEDD